MTVYRVTDFIKWALTHVRASTIPSGAVLPLPIAECGTEPWQYLFGSVRVQTTQATLDYYYDHHYAKQMTRAKYDALTRDWDRNGYATDCQGLLDAWLTYEQDDRTDINADMDYRLWCTDKGKLSEIDRPYVIGEALFMANSAGKMTHIGWVCGFTADGTPLVVEARGIAYGVVVTRLDGRAWTHRGLMTNMFRYQGEKELIKFEVTKPMQSGVPFAKMQEALNYAGYTDADGNVLEVDGKWGRRSQEAFDKLVADYAPEVVPQPDPEAVFIATDGRHRLVLEYK
ncbi:MAG: hypothetical protein II517_04180 [Ruminococcus sp.]|nr:hypothetical protein [Ruminococcus sp.]